MEKHIDPMWVRYFIKDKNFEEIKVGKWMYFFKKDELLRADELCRKAIEQNVVSSCKHTHFDVFGELETGVCCFYLHFDDNEGHKKVLKYFIDNNMIPKTKAGKYHNISFKKDEQTLSREYGDAYYSEIKLEQFIDLFTGKWIK